MSRRSAEPAFLDAMALHLSQWLRQVGFTAESRSGSWPRYVVTARKPDADGGA